MILAHWALALIIAFLVFGALGAVLLWGASVWFKEIQR